MVFLGTSSLQFYLILLPLTCVFPIPHTCVFPIPHLFRRQYYGDIAVRCKDARMPRLLLVKSIFVLR